MSARIWLIDDAASNRRLFSDALESFGYQVETFGLAAPALERAEREVPDLVITDVRMPEIDGFACCRRLRAIWGDELVPIVMLTAIESRDDYVRGLDAGADDYLLQPIDLDELRVRVRSLLRLRAMFVELREAQRKLAVRVDELRDEIASRDRQLVTTDRLAAIGQLAAAVAHDINNPLAYVTSNIDHCLATAPAGLDRAWLDCLRAAQEGAERIRVVVRDVSTFSREATPGDRPSAHVQEVLASAANMAHSTARHAARIHRELPDEPLWAALPTARLAQVALNLIVNAAHAVEDSGERGDITLRARGEGDEVIIEVEDTGVGIAPEDRERIFLSFYTTKREGRGTGLGLSICADIVTGARGVIELESEVGHGSVFRLRLPRAPTPRRERNDPTLADTPRARAEAAAPSPSARVVIIDDEPMVAPVLSRMLAGYDVRSYLDLDDAVDDLADADAIVCDLMMPGTTPIDLYDGLPDDVRRRMIFVTGGAYNDRARDFLGRVPNDALEKPVDPARLRALVADIVKR